MPGQGGVLADERIDFFGKLVVELAGDLEAVGVLPPLAKPSRLSNSKVMGF